MSMTLAEVKNNLRTIGAELTAVLDETLKEAEKPDASMDKLRELEAKKNGLKARFEVFREQHDEMSAQQMGSLQANNKTFHGAAGTNPKVMNSAKASFIRSVARGDIVSSDIRAALGDRNSTGGERILPTTMTNELLHEPFVKNPLRDVSTFTSLTNLEIPKITFKLDNDDFILDTEVARELQAEGDVVKFGRNKFKVFVPISETILAATDTNLAQTVDQALQSGVASKERKVAFAMTPKVGEEHMSFYSTENGIKQIPGTDLFETITLAIADLHEDYRENAKIVMRYADYLNIIKTLANGNTTLYNAQPEQVLGKPVVFCDLAVNPIIGDFRYSHFNYDPQILYDRDKDVKTGVWDFVITAWFDHRIKLKSAFRIVKIQ